jgi:hypothetical protein
MGKGVEGTIQFNWDLLGKKQDFDIHAFMKIVNRRAFPMFGLKPNKYYFKAVSDIMEFFRFKEKPYQYQIFVLKKHIAYFTEHK